MYVLFGGRFVKMVSKRAFFLGTRVPKTPKKIPAPSAPKQKFSPAQPPRHYPPPLGGGEVGFGGSSAHPPT